MESHTFVSFLFCPILNIVEGIICFVYFFSWIQDFQKLRQFLSYLNGVAFCHLNIPAAAHTMYNPTPCAAMMLSIMFLLFPEVLLLFCHLVSVCHLLYTPTCYITLYNQFYVQYKITTITQSTHRRQ